MTILALLINALRILLRVTRPYSLKFLDIVYRCIFGRKPVLPPIDDKILLMPATELARSIRKKELKSEDVVTAYIKRIKETDPIINACLDHRFEDALKDAKEIDTFISSGTKSEDEIERDTPLLGVPFSAKEFIGIKGMKQINGCYKNKSRIAESDGECPALYKKAGAIPLTVTNISEYALFWDTVNCFGRTFNPYDNVRSVGGSSGGEAALLAYAGAIMGVGNDLAGSIRVPAAFNGVYAHNPSPGMIPGEHTWPPVHASVRPFIRAGPLCRYAKDLPLIASVLSEGRIRFDKKVDFRNVKIYYIEEFPGYLLEAMPDIKAAVRKAAQFFDDTYSNKPKKINIPELKYTPEIANALLVNAGFTSIRDVLEKDNPINIYVEFIKIIFGIGEHTIPTLYLLASGGSEKDQNYYNNLAMSQVLKSKLDSVLDGESILLIPTHPEPAVHHLMSIPKFDNKAYTCFTNYYGYPITQIPAGFNDGLPIGIQIFSKQDNDYLCIQTALELEQVFGGWRSPSKIIAK